MLKIWEIYVYIYNYLYNTRKNPKSRSIQIECSMTTAINCIFNLELEIHQNSRAEQKYFYTKIKKKMQFLCAIMNLFQVYVDTLLMSNEDTVKYLIADKAYL